MSDTTEVHETPQSYYGGEHELWTCMFPGKMGISWKRTWGNGTKAEAEAIAAKNANVIAVPLALWCRYKEYERRTVIAERKLMDVCGPGGRQTLRALDGWQ